MAQFKSKLAAGTAAITAEAAAMAPSKAPVKPAPRKATAKAVPPKAAAPKVLPPKLPVTKAQPEVAPAIEASVLETAVPEASVPETAVPAAPMFEAAPLVEPAPEAPGAEAPEPVAEAAPEQAAPEAQPAAPVMDQPEISAPAAVAAEAIPAKLPFFNLKEIAMNDYTANMSDSMSGAVTDVQAKLQAAYEKSTGMVTEMTELAKGNVEAMVESSKLFAAGVQDLGKSYADEAKSAYEIATADLKEMAAIKSPTELFQLQGKIMRRNFETLIASTSKSTDAAMKLANEAMAPLSGRMNIATEKLSTIAA